MKRCGLNIWIYCNTIHCSRLPSSVEQCHDCAAPDMLSVKYNTCAQSFCKSLLPLHLTNKKEHLLTFYISSWRMTIEKNDKKSAGRYFSSFSWLHEEMTYCQKNPITLILKSNICFIKPNPYLADFLRYSKSSSHYEKLYFISNMCSAHAFVDKTTNWVSGFEFQQNLLTTNMKFQFIELNPDLKSWQQWIGINNL